MKWDTLKRWEVDMELVKRIIDANQVAKLLGVSVKQVYILCQETDLPHWKAGTRIYRFHEDSVIAWRDSGGVKAA